MNVKTNRPLNAVMGRWRESAFDSAVANAFLGDDSCDVVRGLLVIPML